MATAAYSPRPTINFQPGVPVTVALKFETGRECNGANGPRFMFTTTDDRVFFLDHEPAHEVEQCARQGGAIVITKTKGPRNSVYWHVKPANAQEARDATSLPTAAPRAIALRNEPNQFRDIELELEAERQRREIGRNASPSDLETKLQASIAHVQQRQATREEVAGQQPITTAQAKLLAALCVAIDSCVEAQVYAERRGLPLAFTGEDVRCFANTILINAERGAR